MFNNKTRYEKKRVVRKTMIFLTKKKNEKINQETNDRKKRLSRFTLMGVDQ